MIGEVVATVKDANLTGTTLLVLQPLAAEASRRAGRSWRSIRSAPASARTSSSFAAAKAAFPFYPAEPPTDAAIVGIVDHWDVEERPTADGEDGCR